MSKNTKHDAIPTSVPTEKDWGNYNADLDQRHAHSVFAGRTNNEMRAFSRRNVIEMTDGLRWMPEVPFRYYMLGFRDFVLARDFERLGAASATSCFLALVLEKLERQPPHIFRLMPELLPTAEFVARNQSLFEADEKIYGNFLEKLQKIKKLCGQS